MSKINERCCYDRENKNSIILILKLRNSVLIYATPYYHVIYCSKKMVSYNNIPLGGSIDKNNEKTILVSF